MALRLNLASGTDLKRGDGWVNLDAVSWKMAGAPPDVFWNAKDPIPFPDESVDEVYAGYLLLHTSTNWHTRMMADIWRVMKPCARLVIGEVDMAILLPRWMADPSNKYLIGLIWGEGGTEHGEDMASWDNHACGFTEASLRALLSSAGFDGARRIKVHGDAVWYELSLEVTK